MRTMPGIQRIHKQQLTTAKLTATEAWENHILHCPDCKQYWRVDRRRLPTAEKLSQAQRALIRNQYNNVCDDGWTLLKAMTKAMYALWEWNNAEIAGQATLC